MSSGQRYGNYPNCHGDAPIVVTATPTEGLWGSQKERRARPLCIRFPETGSKEEKPAKWSWLGRKTVSPPRSEVMNGRDGGKGDVGDLIVHEHSCTIYRKGDRSRTSNHWLKQM